MNTVKKFLEDSKKKLIDLSRRNNLLNYNKLNKSNSNCLDISNINIDYLLLGDTLNIYSEESYNKLTSKIQMSGVVVKDHSTILLNSLLTKKRREFNSRLKETGSNSLYLAVFFISWKNSAKSNPEEFNAPLILIPILLTQSTKFHQIQYDISDDIFLNESLKLKLKNDFSINLPDFIKSDEPSYDDLEHYIQKLNDFFEEYSEYQFEITDNKVIDFFEFNKLLMYKDLENSQWLNNHTLLELTHSIETNTYENYISAKPRETEKLPLILDADASQREAINAVMSGQTLVIQGPPGTGKSQTIANLIALAISQNKTVLFVAEKLVALEVVYARLAECGFDPFILELHSNKMNESSFYSSIKKRLEQSQTEEQKSTEEFIKKSNVYQNTLDSYLAILHSPINQINKTPYELFGITNKFYNAKFIQKQEYPAFLNYSHDNYNTVLEKVELFVRNLNIIQDSVWRDTYIQDETLETDVPQILNIINTQLVLIQNIENQVQNDLEKRLLNSKSFIKNIENMINHEDDILDIQNVPSSEELAIIKNINIDTLEYLFKQLNEFYNLYAPFKYINFEVLEKNTLDILSKKLSIYESVGAFKNLWNKLFDKDYQAIMKEFKEIFNIKAKNPQQMLKEINLLKDYISDYNQILKSLEKYKLSALISRIDEEYSVSNLKNIKFVSKVNEYITEILNYQQIVSWKKEIESYNLDDFILEHLYSDHNDQFIGNGITFYNKISDILEQHEHNLAKLSEYINLEKTTYFYKNTDELVDTLNKKLCPDEELNQANLKTWIEAFKIQCYLEKAQLSDLIHFAKTNNLLSNFKELFIYSFHATWSKHVFEKNEVLKKFDSTAFDFQRQKFIDTDEQLSKVHQNNHIAHLLTKKAVNGKRSSKTSEYTELALIEHQINLTKRHRKIRDFLSNASESILNLKPCFMMSPLSVAQYLDPKIQFDIMIMDEASQVFPEDAIGSIVRAKQVVVVGDTKQLAPSNFFNAILKQEEDDLDIPVAESILDLMLGVYPNKRQLNWHYRSRHHSLIDFSNHYFYENKLMVFPSPNMIDANYGFSYIYIQDANFINSINTTEAKAIRDEIINFYNSSEYEKRLGVVAMNKKQADYIQDLIDKFTDMDLINDTDHMPNTCKERIIHALNNNMLFIKNLENIQGDEVDILYIGITYAPQKIGTPIAQRFGEFNKEDSWRRINVLATRAKERIKVFASLKSSDISIDTVVNNDSANIHGKKAFKAFLQYAENNGKLLETYSPSGRLPDSPFEESVIAYIQSLGFIADCQIGVSGFFIDIGVKKSRDSNYFVGIECDGATYHSSKSARDRDRIRQNVLENLGWKIYRIWSTDWFKNRTKACEDLKNYLL